MSIYTFLKENTGFETDCKLPDHDDLGLQDGQTWVPGAYEGIVMRSTYSIRRPAAMNYFLAKKVARQIKKPSDKNREAEETAVRKAGALATVDSLISFITKFGTDKALVRKEALRLCTECDKREPVKVGIGLLGSFGEPEDAEIIETLGRHEEFTFYACPALKALLGEDSYNDAVLALARETDGWGKLAAIYELDFGRDYVKDFLLRDGCRNRLGNEEAANLCATKGKLIFRLREMAQADNAPLEDDFRGICDILDGLTAYDGQHDSLNDYKYGAEVPHLWKELLEKFPSLEETDSRAGRILQKMR